MGDFGSSMFNSVGQDSNLDRWQIAVTNGVLTHVGQDSNLDRWQIAVTNGVLTHVGQDSNLDRSFGNGTPHSSPICFRNQAEENIHSSGAATKPALTGFS